MRASLAYRDEAKVHLPGGVSSSWQMWPPHPIYVDRGLGAHVWDIDGNEYVDYHNGYGVMVMGHAHPKIVEAVQKRVSSAPISRSRPRTRCPSPSNLAERTGLPYWRFGNSGTEATLDVVRIMRASTGRDLVLKIEGTYHGHHDALMVSVFPPRGQGRPARTSDVGAADERSDPRHSSTGSSTCRSTTPRRRSRSSPSTAARSPA